MVGVSGDAEETNARFRESCGLPYPLVGDPKGRILSAYRVKWPLVGLSRRVTYVIGRDRRVRHVSWNELNVEAHIAEASSSVAKAGSGAG